MPFTGAHLKGQQLIGSGDVVPIGARQNAIGNIQELRSGPYTLHHILPYRYPAFFGYLATCFRRDFLRDRPIVDCRSDGSQFLRDFGDFVVMIETHAQNVQGELTQKFAWMGPNLFEGPAPLHRIDDPGNLREASMPLSMHQSANWDPLDLLHRAIDEMVTFSGDAEGENYVTAGRSITLDDLATLFRIMRPTIDRQHGNAHPFHADDWLCMEHPGGAVSRDVFRNILDHPERRREIRYYKPTVDAAGPRMFWRLRRNEDPIPNDTAPVRTR